MSLAIEIVIEGKIISELNKIIKRNKKFEEEINKQFDNWKKDPCYDLCFYYEDPNNDSEYIDLASEDECRELQEAQEALWEYKRLKEDSIELKAYKDAIKYARISFFGD